MDVYHKILVKIYEITGGKDSVDVDLVDLLKKEGFFPSLNAIATQLMDESWVTETSRKNVVRITHWGKAEAKKSLVNAPDTEQEVLKDSTRLVSYTREFLVMLEDFVGAPSVDKFATLEKRFDGIAPVLRKIKDNLK